MKECFCNMDMSGKLTTVRDTNSTASIVSFARGTLQQLQEAFKGKQMPHKCEVYLDDDSGRLFFARADELELTYKNKNDIIFVDNESRGYIGFEELAGSGLEGTL